MWYWYLIFMAWKAVNVDQALVQIVTTLLLADGCNLLNPPPPPLPHYIVGSEICFNS